MIKSRIDEVYQCEQSDVSSRSSVVQDNSRSVKNMLERLGSGVINPESLDQNMLYGDIPIPAKYDRLDLYDMARANAFRLSEMQAQMQSQAATPDPTPSSDPTPPVE